MAKGIYPSYWYGDVHHLAPNMESLTDKPPTATLCGISLKGLSYEPQSSSPSEWIECPVCKAKSQLDNEGEVNYG